MKTLTCSVNGWNVEARIDEMEQNKLLAIVSARPDHDEVSAPSRHVVVFDHRPGSDEAEEVRTVLTDMLPPLQLPASRLHTNERKTDGADIVEIVQQLAGSGRSGASIDVRRHPA